MENVRLIASRSNGKLATNMAKDLGIGLTVCEIKDHANREINIQIKDNIRGSHVYIIATGASNKTHSINDYIMEIILLVDACRRSSAKYINLIVASYPYARADKKDDGRTSIGGTVFADLVEKVGVTRIVALDLHASQIQGFTSLPFDNLYAINLFINCFKNDFFKDMTNEEINEQYILVSPDAGGTKRVKAYAKKLLMNYAVMDKQRDYSKSGVVEKSQLFSIPSVVGKTAIVIDDMADTCGTMVAACNELLTHGIKDVIVVVTHGVLSGEAIDRLNTCDAINAVIVTDSLPQDDNIKSCPKLIVVDISPLLAEVIKRMETGASISELFK